METDALKAAFRYITGPLSPDAERAVTRAKNIAERALPQDAGDKTAVQPKARPKDTGVTLAVDPSANLVIARVIDRATGELIRQIPSEASVRFVTASRALLGQEVEAKYKEASAQADADPEQTSQTLVTV
jgi:hypothetical protein